MPNPHTFTGDPENVLLRFNLTFLNIDRKRNR